MRKSGLDPDSALWAGLITQTRLSSQSSIAHSFAKNLGSVRHPERLRGRTAAEESRALWQKRYLAPGGLLLAGTPLPPGLVE
jgi:hypothetical protein